MLYGNIGPIIPGRYSNLLGQLIDTINGATHIATCNYQSLVNTLYRILYDSHDILFTLALQILLVYLLGLDNLTDELAVNRTHNHGLTAYGGCIINHLSLLPCYGLEILLQSLKSNLNAALIGLIGQDLNRFAVLNQRKPVSR